MNENNDNKIDITKYLDRFYRSLIRYKLWIFAIIACFVILFEVKTFLFFHYTYSSEAVFIASTKNQSNIYSTSDSSDDFINSFGEVITGDLMRGYILEDLQVDTIPADISLNRIPDTNLMRIKTTASDAEDAYAVINCILNNYDKVTDMVMDDASLLVLDTPQLATAADETPDYLKAGLSGLWNGCILALILVFIMMLFRHTVCSNDDVKKDLSLTNLAKIPFTVSKVKKYRNGSNLLISNPRIQYSFRQAFHDIRIKIEQEYRRNKSKVFMITSTVPNEGKTTVSCNIAISLADKGHKVALIDLDLRNPSILNTIGQSELTGNIVGYLNGELALDEIKNKYLDYSLDIIYGVNSYDEPTKLLSKEKFKKFIAFLKKEYDFVILDVPPLYMMQDALLIAKESDAAIIVIKQDYANTYDILEAVDEINDYVPSIVGTVLNQVKPSIFDQEQSTHGYGYGYGYGYGRK